LAYIKYLDSAFTIDTYIKMYSGNR